MTAAGLMKGRLVAGRFLFSFAIHPALAVIVTGQRRAESSRPTVDFDAVHHSPALGGGRYRVRAIRESPLQNHRRPQRPTEPSKSCSLAPKKKTALSGGFLVIP